MSFKAKNDFLMSHILLEKENSFRESKYRYTLQTAETIQIHLRRYYFTKQHILEKLSSHAHKLLSSMRE